MSWNVVAAFTKGTSHIRDNTPCQDCCTHKVALDGVLVLAVADGLGSAAHSDVGAMFAVNHSISDLESSLSHEMPVGDDQWRARMRDAFANARQFLVHHAEENSRDLRSLATTLTCAVVLEHTLVVGHLGDGFLVVDNGHSLRTIAAPSRGEYANEVCPLTDGHALEALDIQIHQTDARAVFVSTDGLLRLALRLPDCTPHEPFFRPLQGFAQSVTNTDDGNAQLKSFLESERVCQRTDDDKTLLIAIRSTQS